MKARPLAAEDPLYPSSDGKPLAENDWQLWAILDAAEAPCGATSRTSRTPTCPETS